LSKIIYIELKMVVKLKKLVAPKKFIVVVLIAAAAALVATAVVAEDSPLLMFPHKARAATTSISGVKALSAISDPNYILSGNGQGQIQCPANPASSNAYRSLQLTFGANRAGGSITGSFDISNNHDGRSIIGGSIDGGQIIQNHFTLTGTARETFGFVCGSSSSTTSSSSSGGSGGGNSISNNGVPTSNTLAVPTHFTISGQCGGGGSATGTTTAATTTTMQFTGANGETGSFAGPVSCNFANTNNYAGSSSPSSSSSTQQQYQTQNPNQDLYSSYRNSNEYKQGSIAYQQCIDAAAKVGNKLSDYEITNCQKNPSYRH
jgi:hypothetical protein